jgi:hypothetical protein
MLSVLDVVNFEAILSISLLILFAMNEFKNAMCNMLMLSIRVVNSFDIVTSGV